MNNAELIARVRSIAKHGADWRINWVLRKAADLIESQAKQIEGLEAQIPKNGEWIEDTYNSGHNLYTCSVCGLAMITTPDYVEKHYYCYGCGAKNKVKWMKGEQK